MSQMMMKLKSIQEFLRRELGEAPPVALVLGSGYAVIGQEVEQARSLAFGDIPGFPVCTNPAHPGRLIVGQLYGKPAAVMQGRIHCYEGYRADEVVVPVRALALWGVKTFILTNAAGAINPAFRTGEFMALTDHINMLGQNPLTGPNLNELGPRFPDISQAYTRRLIAGAKAAADKAGMTLHQGVYAAMPGPSYESPAEIRMLGVVGADAVGMSTVPEALALSHMGREVFGLSCLTNLAAGISQETLSDNDIVQVLDRPEVLAGLKAVIAGVLHVA